MRANRAPVATRSGSGPPPTPFPDGEGESVLPGLHLLSLLGVEVESGTLLSPGENGRHEDKQEWVLCNPRSAF